MSDPSSRTQEAPAAADHGHDHDHPHPHPHDDAPAAAADHRHDHDHPHDDAPAAAADHGHDHDHPHPHPHDDAPAAAADHGHDHDAGYGHGEGHGHDHGHGHGHGDGHDHDHATGIRGFIMSLVAPHSHDAADSIDTALESSAKGIYAVKVSLVALMVTALLQVAIVLVTGSVALLADTIHNFSDALTSVPLWIAFVLGRRVANRRYTYGYRRAEDIAGLFIVGMITFSAILAGWESIQRLLNPQPITNVSLVFAAGVIGFIGNELVALYRIRVGREIGSAALIADGLHARTDGFTSLAVVIGAIGVWLGFPQADPLIGLLITVAILWVLKDAAKSVFARLMDAVDPILVDQIEQVAVRSPGILHVESVRVRWIGHRLEASLNVVVDCEMTVAKGHEVAEGVRHAMFHDVRGLDAVLVHVDPCEHETTDHHSETRGHDLVVPTRPAGRDAARAIPPA